CAVCATPLPVPLTLDVGTARYGAPLDENRKRLRPLATSGTDIRTDGLEPALKQLPTCVRMPSIVSPRASPAVGASTILVDVLKPPAVPPVPKLVLVTSHAPKPAVLPATLSLSATLACRLSAMASTSRRRSSS